MREGCARFPDWLPVRGMISYQANGEKYSGDIFIDVENYAVFFSNSDEYDDLMIILTDGAMSLKNIARSMKKQIEISMIGGLKW